MPGRIGARSSCFIAGSLNGGTGVTSPSRPWPETPRRASFTGRGSDEPFRREAPRRIHVGKELFFRGAGAPSSVTGVSRVSLAIG